jgi:hypothetical protein
MPCFTAAPPTTGFLSNGQPHSTFMFGSYRSYSQGNEKENERELAILLYYDNGERVP